jgi:hypothetical protein
MNFAVGNTSLSTASYLVGWNLGSAGRKAGHAGCSQGEGMRTWTGLTGVAFLGLALCAEEPAPAPSPQNIQDSQQRLGEQVGRIGESLEELLQEAQANLGVEMQSFDTFRHTRERLADLSQHQMPTICSELRDPTTKALYTAWRRQDEIAGELSRLLLAVRRQLAPALSRRVLDTALDRQQEALERTRDLRTAYPNLEGMPPQALSEEQQRALSETAEAQEQAAEELARARAELQRQTDALAGGDVSTRQTLRQAQQELQQNEVPVKAGAAAEDLRANHTRQAEEKQEDLVKALKDADGALAPPAGPSSRSAERLAALQEAAGQQAQALEETNRLEKGPSEDDLVRAARDQGDVSGRLHDLSVKEPELKTAHVESEAAKRSLVEGEMAAARQAQEKVLKALQAALQEAASELASTQRQELRSDSTTLELDRLRALLRRQDELLARTTRVTAQRAHALAREQAELARETDALSAQTPASRAGPSPSPEALLELLSRLVEQAKTDAAQGAAESDRHMREVRQTTDAISPAAAEEDPETFYSAREMTRQAEAQGEQSGTAARDAAKAAEEAAQAVGGRKLASNELERALRLVAEAALRGASSVCRAAYTPEQRQRAERLQSQVLQAAALAGSIGLPPIADSLKNAGRAMTEATDELANQRPEAALPKQQAALAALGAALHRLAAELGQLDLASLLSLLRDEAVNLTDAQTRLTVETASASAPFAELAPRQQGLSEQSERLGRMPGVPAPAAKALGEAGERMRQAADDLKQNRIAAAKDAQKRADEGLALALQELKGAAAAAQMAAPMSVGTEAAKPGKSDGEKLAPAIEVVTPRDVTGTSWNVALPPRERGEVNQALKEKMPARYRRQIMLYYENLARVGLE